MGARRPCVVRCRSMRTWAHIGEYAEAAEVVGYLSRKASVREHVGRIEPALIRTVHAGEVVDTGCHGGGSVWEWVRERRWRCERRKRRRHRFARASRGSAVGNDTGGVAGADQMSADGG